MLYKVIKYLDKVSGCWEPGASGEARVHDHCTHAVQGGENAAQVEFSKNISTFKKHHVFI